MRIPGQRSQTVRCLLDTPDVQALSDSWGESADADLLHGSSDGVAHANLAASLRADGMQVSVRRRSWDSPGVYLRSSLWPGTVRTFIDGWNDRAHAFVWTKTADAIHKKANRPTTSEPGR